MIRGGLSEEVRFKDLFFYLKKLCWFAKSARQSFFQEEGIMGKGFAGKSLWLNVLRDGENSAG